MSSKQGRNTLKTGFCQATKGAVRCFSPPFSILLLHDASSRLTSAAFRSPHQGNRGLWRPREAPLDVSPSKPSKSGQKNSNFCRFSPQKKSNSDRDDHVCHDLSHNVTQCHTNSLALVSAGFRSFLLISSSSRALAVV